MVSASKWMSRLSPLILKPRHSASVFGTRMLFRCFQARTIPFYRGGADDSELMLNCVYLFYFAYASSRQLFTQAG